MESSPNNGVAVSGVGVLDKVMEILQLFPSGRTSLEPPSVAESLGIAAPTAYRLMKAMTEHGLLTRDGQGYRLGVTLLHFGARVAEGLDLMQVARPHLEWLRDQTSENAELHLRHGNARVPVEVVPSPNNLRPMGQPGVPLLLHAGASAKVLLAWLEPEERRSLVLSSHERSGSEGPFDMAKWERALAKTRKQGWADSYGEREVGLASIAAPVRDHAGSVVAAIVVSGPSERLKKRPAQSVAVQSTLEAANRISRAIGNASSIVGRKLA